MTKTARSIAFGRFQTPYHDYNTRGKDSESRRSPMVHGLITTGGRPVTIATFS
jgi:hypothetical protein